MQRLYGTAFFSQKDLDAYLHQVEEAKKRDHRVLGKQLKLFTISQLVGSGLILWMPQGGDRPRHPRDLHQGRTGQARLLSRSTLRTSAGWSCIAPAAIFPITATPSFRRCIIAPRPARSICASIAWPMGELDDKREHEYQEYMKQAHMLPPELQGAPTRGDKLEIDPSVSC